MTLRCLRPLPWVALRVVYALLLSFSSITNSPIHHQTEQNLQIQRENRDMGSVLIWWRRNNNTTLVPSNQDFIYLLSLKIIHMATPSMIHARCAYSPRICNRNNKCPSQQAPLASSCSSSSSASNSSFSLSSGNFHSLLNPNPQILFSNIHFVAFYLLFQQLRAFVSSHRPIIHSASVILNFSLSYQSIFYSPGEALNLRSRFYKYL